MIYITVYSNQQEEENIKAPFPLYVAIQQIKIDIYRQVVKKKQKKTLLKQRNQWEDLKIPSVCLFMPKRREEKKLRNIFELNSTAPIII